MAFNYSDIMDNFDVFYENYENLNPDAFFEEDSVDWSKNLCPLSQEPAPTLAENRNENIFCSGPSSGATNFSGPSPGATNFYGPSPNNSASTAENVPSDENVGFVSPSSLSSISLPPFAENSAENPTPGYVFSVGNGGVFSYEEVNKALLEFGDMVKRDLITKGRLKKNHTEYGSILKEIRQRTGNKSIRPRSTEYSRERAKMLKENKRK